METIKAYTDIEQSKKLAEILPPDSADMEYMFLKEDNSKVSNIAFVKDDDEPEWPTDSAYDFIPCWSLAALHDSLPNNKHISTTVSRGGWSIEPVDYMPNTWWCEYEDSENYTEFSTSADNPVDACYEMIIKLKEQKLL